MKQRILIFILVFFTSLINLNSVDITSSGISMKAELSQNSSYSYPDRIVDFNFNGFNLDFSDVSGQKLTCDVQHNVNKNSTLIITKLKGDYSTKLCEDSIRNSGSNTCIVDYSSLNMIENYLYAYVCTPNLNHCTLTNKFKFLQRNTAKETEGGIFIKYSVASNFSYFYADRVVDFNFNGFNLDFSDVIGQKLTCDVQHNINKDSTLIITKLKGDYSTKLCEDSIRSDGNNTCVVDYNNLNMDENYLYAYVCTPSQNHCTLTNKFKFLQRNTAREIEAGVSIKYSFNDTLLQDPSYVTPTPLNGSVYNYQEKFIMTIDSFNKTFESCRVDIDGINYPMILNGKRCTYNLTVENKNLPKDIEFQAFYTVSGLEEALEKRMFSIESSEEENYIFPSNSIMSIVLTSFLCVLFLF